MVTYAQGTFQVDYEARVDFDRLRSARVAKTQAVVTDGEPEVLNRCGFDERLS